MSAKTVEEYVAGLEDWQAQIASGLRKLVREAAPDASEAIKWAQPVYEENGPFCYIKAFKKQVNLGFWRGAQLDDPKESWRVRVRRCVMSRLRPGIRSDRTSSRVSYARQSI